MPEGIKALSESARVAAATAGRIAREHGTDSRQYDQAYAAYKAAKVAYEDECRSAGRQPYAFYSED